MNLATNFKGKIDHNDYVDIHNAYGLFQQSSGIYHSTRAYKKGVKLDGS